jgi:integrase
LSRATGIRARHSRRCRSRGGGKCNCYPSYEAWAWSPRDGTKIRRTFHNLAEAKGWRHDAASAVRKGTLSAPTRQTLNEAAEAWLEGAKRGTVLTRSGQPYKPSVIRGYEADLRRYVLPDLGAQRLAALRRADLQALVDRLVADGRSPSKIHSVVMPLRVLCRHAIERDEILVNPTTNLRLPVANGRRDRVASPQEAAALIEALPEEDRALWSTACYAGLRRGELLALRWSDVDLEANVIHVKRGWDQYEGEIEPKSHKGRRSVPVAEPLRLVLLERKASTGRRGADFVFGRSADAPFAPMQVRRRALGAWAAAAIGSFFRGEVGNLEPIGLHELRHGYVSLMHDAGFSLERIGDYVGHSSSYMVDRYRHLLEGHEQEAADMFSSYLERKTGAQTGAQRAETTQLRVM